MPCALLTLAAIVVLGPPLGRTCLDAARGLCGRAHRATRSRRSTGASSSGCSARRCWRRGAAVARRPRRRGRRCCPHTIRVLVRAGQLALLAFVLLCFAAQNNIVFSADFSVLATPHVLHAADAGGRPRAGAGARRSHCAGGVRARHSRARCARRARAGSPALVAAVYYTAIWLLTAIDPDSSIANTIGAVAGHVLWTLAEPFAVLNGRTPLVDFHAQYGQLWAYLAAAPMALLGATVGIYTIDDGDRHRARAAGRLRDPAAAGAQLARRARAVRAVRGDRLLHDRSGPPDDRYGPANLFMPLADPLRRADTCSPGSRRGTSTAPRRGARGSLFLARRARRSLNNPDFGVAASAATFVALACAAPPRVARAMRAARLAGGRRARSARIALVRAADARALRLAAALRPAARVLAAVRDRRLGAAADAGARAYTSPST